MNKVVLDASALLALINEETGSERVADLLPQAIMSTVNYSEVIMILIQAGLKEIKATEIVNNLLREIIPFGRNQAIETAILRDETKKYGLSLGDRACLALAKLNKIPAITADKSWGKLNVGINIELIR